MTLVEFKLETQGFTHFGLSGDTDNNILFCFILNYYYQGPSTESVQTPIVSVSVLFLLLLVEYMAAHRIV